MSLAYEHEITQQKTNFLRAKWIASDGDGILKETYNKKNKSFLPKKVKEYMRKGRCVFGRDIWSWYEIYRPPKIVGTA